MKNELFTLSDFAQDNNGKLTVIGTFDTIFSKELPAQHPLLCIAARIRFDHNETGKHVIKIELTDPQNKSILPPLESEIFIENMTDDTAVANIVLQLNMINFNTLGKYYIRLFVDNTELAINPLYLKRAQ